MKPAQMKNTRARVTFKLSTKLSEKALNGVMKLVTSVLSARQSSESGAFMPAVNVGPGESLGRAPAQLTGYQVSAQLLKPSLRDMPEGT